MSICHMTLCCMFHLVNLVQKWTCLNQSCYYFWFFVHTGNERSSQEDCIVGYSCIKCSRSSMHRECTVYIFQVQVICQYAILNIAKGSLSSSIPQFLWDSVYINALSLSQRLINPGWRITLCDQYSHTHTHTHFAIEVQWLLLSIMENILNPYPAPLSRHYHESRSKVVVLSLVNRSDVYLRWQPMCIFLDRYKIYLRYHRVFLFSRNSVLNLFSFHSFFSSLQKRGAKGEERGAWNDGPNLSV